jgi:outer membrane protein
VKQFGWVAEISLSLCVHQHQRSNMKTIVTALLALGFAAGSLGTANAADSPWQIRARVLQLDPANKSDPIGGVGAADQI